MPHFVYEKTEMEIARQAQLVIKLTKMFVDQLDCCPTEALRTASNIVLPPIANGVEYVKASEPDQASQSQADPRTESNQSGATGQASADGRKNRSFLAVVARESNPDGSAGDMGEPTQPGPGQPQVDGP